MRIKELADLVGVSTRAVRHYHRQGLMPEPERQPNGYRDYRLHDAIILARIRRLIELGLSLAEVRDVLADDGGRDLHEILAELDADLARKEAEIHARRERLAGLIDRARRGDLHPEDPVTPEMVALLDELRSDPGRPSSALADRERELFALMDSTADPVDRDRVVAAMRDTATDPEFAERGHELKMRLAELAEAAVDDPRIPELVEDLVAALPAELLSAMAPEGRTDTDGPVGRAVLETMSAAQAEVLRRALQSIAQRDRR